MQNDQQPYMLLVDDDPSSKKAFENYFGELGWRLDYVDSRVLALQAASENHYDIIVTGLELSAGDGLSFLQDLTRDNPAQAVMFVTESNSSNDGQQLVDSGAVDVVSKPVELKTIHATIMNIMGFASEQGSQVSGHDVECHYEFSSQCLASLDFIPPIVDELFDSNLIDQGTKQRIVLAFQEALTNSLEHGNLELESVWKDVFDEDGVDKYSLTKAHRLYDPEFSKRKIYIRTIYDRASLKIEIKDEGRGFTPPEHMCKPQIDLDKCDLYGRGLTILCGTMDAVWYSADGTFITIVKKLH